LFLTFFFLLNIILYNIVFLSVEGTNQAWNQFMTLNTGLYTSSLDTHLKNWKKLGVKYKAHKYTNPLDGESMFVLLTYNPNTGNVVEVHGSTTTDYVDEFVSLPDSVCTEAVAPGHTLKSIEESYQNVRTTTHTENIHVKLEYIYSCFFFFFFQMLFASSLLFFFFFLLHSSLSHSVNL
jgi:hypothetical protein